MKRYVTALMALFVLLALISAATIACVPVCKKVTGGGWILVRQQRDNPKATFGFEVQTDPVTGNLEYQDHLNGYNVKSTVINTLSCSGNTATFTGFATINGEGNFAFTVVVTDAGEPGSDDTFSISIPSFGGYSVSGTLGGGNIQIHF